MGGDEFAILVEDGGDAVSVVARILDGFTQPAAVGRDLVPLAASIGVAELSAGDCSPQPGEFLHRADAAMYHAKRTAKAEPSSGTSSYAQPTRRKPQTQQPYRHRRRVTYQASRSRRATTAEVLTHARSAG